MRKPYQPSPCEACKRKPDCPARCYPKLDFEKRHRKERRWNGKGATA